jgi:hypothetical protein
MPIHLAVLCVKPARVLNVQARRPRLGCGHLPGKAIPAEVVRRTDGGPPRGRCHWPPGDRLEHLPGASHPLHSEPYQGPSMDEVLTPLSLQSRASLQRHAPRVGWPIPEDGPHRAFRPRAGGSAPRPSTGCWRPRRPPGTTAACAMTDGSVMAGAPGAPRRGGGPPLGRRGGPLASGPPPCGVAPPETWRAAARSTDRAAGGRYPGPCPEILRYPSPLAAATRYESSVRVV